MKQGERTTLFWMKSLDLASFLYCSSSPRDCTSLHRHCEKWKSILGWLHLEIESPETAPESTQNLPSLCEGWFGCRDSVLLYSSRWTFCSLLRIWTARKHQREGIAGHVWNHWWWTAGWTGMDRSEKFHQRRWFPAENCHLWQRWGYCLHCLHIGEEITHQ